MDKSITSSRKKYSLGTDVDKEAVFDFNFILDEETVSFIENFGKVMFVMRGPPNTGKATLSDMLTTKYSEAVFCCADEYFRNSFTSPARSKESLKASHGYCQRKCKTACEKGVKTIIVQNTHMKKWEMQPYLNFAATYNYTVVMAITLYKYDVTPESLHANNTDGLDLHYFRKRLSQWEDVTPVLTGWFLGPSDSSVVLLCALEALKELVGDGKFCRIFDVFDTDEVACCFKAKQLLFGLAGYTTDSYKMEDHYLSDTVQEPYGKCFTITILGFHINSSGVNAIVDINEYMQPLIFEAQHESCQVFSDGLRSLNVDDNIHEHNKTFIFQDIVAPEASSITFSDWDENEEINVKNCTLIHLAQQPNELFNIGKVREEFQKSLRSAADANGVISANCFTELENNVKVYRLESDEWIVKTDQKLNVKTIYSGLYN